MGLSYIAFGSFLEDIVKEAPLSPGSGSFSRCCWRGSEKECVSIPALCPPGMLIGADLPENNGHFVHVILRVENELLL